MYFVTGSVAKGAVRITAGMLLAGMAWGQSGKTSTLPDVLLTSNNTSATTNPVPATGVGVVRFTMGKPLASPNGACLRVNAEILRNGSPATSQLMVICNSASRAIEVNSVGAGQYALRLSRLDSWNTVPINFTEMKAFYPSGAVKISLNIPGSFVLAPGIIQEREFDVPGPGALTIRVKWSGNVNVTARLRRPDGSQTAPTPGFRGSLTMQTNVTAPGTYRLIIQNTSSSGTANVAVDQIEFLPAS